jgi:hypothetical protein
MNVLIFVLALLSAVALAVGTILLLVLLLKVWREE